jgi:hypothetical protein
MIVQERADQLIEKMRSVCGNMGEYEANWCAWYMTVELMSELHGHGQLMRYNFYKEVKNEIEKKINLLRQETNKI